jgi:hypothetical protein
MASHGAHGTRQLMGLVRSPPSCCTCATTQGDEWRDEKQRLRWDGRLCRKLWAGIPTPGLQRNPNEGGRATSRSTSHWRWNTTQAFCARPVFGLELEMWTAPGPVIIEKATGWQMADAITGGTNWD